MDITLKDMVKDILGKHPLNNFTIKELIHLLSQRGAKISRIWLSEILNQLGYKYDKLNKVWYYAQIDTVVEKQEYVKKEEFDKLLKENTQLVESNEELTKVLSKVRQESDTTRNRLIEQVEKRNNIQEELDLQISKNTKLEKMICEALEEIKRLDENVSSRKLCANCSKKSKCSSRNRFFNKPCDVVVNLTLSIPCVRNTIERIFQVQKGVE